MFSKKEKPLPQAVLKPQPKTSTDDEHPGILLGKQCYWNPEQLPNSHLVAIGASGSGKTQTLKAIALELHLTYPQTQIIILDFHGDQQIEGETCYPLNMASDYGINPLTINPDTEGGGSNLQAILVTNILKKSLRLGPNQEGKLLEIIKSCYHQRGLYQDKPQTWTLEPPNFDDLEEELTRRTATKDDNSQEFAKTIKPKSLPIGQPNTSGIYFLFHQNQLIYIGSARHIAQRLDSNRLSIELGIRYPQLLSSNSQLLYDEHLEIRYLEQPNDWEELIKLENHLIQIHQPPSNQTTLKTECKESIKLKLKLTATFQYGIFSRPQPQLTENFIRIDLSKLPPDLAAIAAESLANQLMNQHRLLGETKTKLPRTYLFIDEAKEMPKTDGSACDRIIADGRKYGLALVLASQSERHLSKDVISNSASKIVLPVDQTEVKKVSTKFRFAEKKVAELTPLTALCRFGKHAQQTEILPYYQRI
jgi:hypothetical protein